jgi:hypothetical protein
MTGMEWFRDVGRGELDQNSLGSFRRIFRVLEAEEFVLSKALFSDEDGRYKDFSELVDFEKEL